MPLKTDDKTAIIAQLRKSLSKCCPPMVVSKDTEDTLELIGNKPVPYGSKKKIVPGMYFASFVARKDSVSLYFFAIYFHAKDYEKTIPNLGKVLKGKTCFIFKKPEQVFAKELDAMLKQGVKAWKKNGYMK
jgi:hypothetical protein